VKQEFDKVCKEIPKVPMEVDTPLEYQVEKVIKDIQVFIMKIVELETQMTPSTPREERYQREKTIRTAMESIQYFGIKMC
jgi:hypothetical protein